MRLKAVQEIGHAIYACRLLGLLWAEDGASARIHSSITAVRYNNQVQEAALLHNPEGDDSQAPTADFNQLQKGLTFPLTTRFYTKTTCSRLSTMLAPGHYDTLMDVSTRIDCKLRDNRPTGRLPEGLSSAF